MASRVAAAAAVLALSSAGVAAKAADQPGASIPARSPEPAPDTEACDPAPPPVSMRSATLWDAQPALIAKCLALVPAHAADHPNVYTVAIAPLGTQTLFSREARLALQRLAANYGGTAKRGILLSNSTVDIMKVPLATQANIAQVLGAIGQRTAASPDDLLIVYLASHGRPDAALASALPDNIPIIAISADSLGEALDQANIRRRIIIISACFAGSWIPRLANDDTIVITAARADRTSFGCDDTRPLTYFGEAFLNGPLSRGASLAESFDGARKTVTQWETEQKLLNSEPQVYVGKNMLPLWQTTAPGAVTIASAAGAKPVTATARRSKTAAKQP